jgi:hypothetical protein
MNGRGGICSEYLLKKSERTVYAFVFNKTVGTCGLVSLVQGKIQLQMKLHVAYKAGNF